MFCLLPAADFVSNGPLRIFRKSVEPRPGNCCPRLKMAASTLQTEMPTLVPRVHDSLMVWKLWPTLCIRRFTPSRCRAPVTLSGQIYQAMPGSKRRVLLSWSSGKDSAWCLHVLNQQPDTEVVGLLTTFNESADRVAMHAVRRQLVETQAESVGLPLFPVMLPWPCSNDDYEGAM